MLSIDINCFSIFNEVAISQISPLVLILQIMKIVWVQSGFNKIYNLWDGHKNIFRGISATIFSHGQDTLYIVFL